MSVENEALPSLTPYLMRAFYEWCVDNAFTPQILVVAEDQDTDVQVPRDFVSDGKIALNIGPTACGSLEIENDSVHFDARFSGQLEHIWIPIGNIVAIYARENGACIPFELERAVKAAEPEAPAGFGFTRVD